MCKKKLPNVPLRIGQFLELPFSNQEIDTVISAYAFHHCQEKDQFQVIQEISRILKDDGICIIGDVMFKNQNAKDIYEKQCTPLQQKELHDEHFAVLDSLEYHFQQAGFHCIMKQVDEIIWVIVAKKVKKNGIKK